ncbi:class I SAM-dependent methyltransferase [Bradyrhizobium sp. STM 3557]|uniref:class I SAM-dependent methyltransferase n=1 Tax=Bradyrhizobium sp. STM 3557 TaxID=578920 RepID=UPI00388D4E30
MQSEDRRAHWESVYSKKRENEVSWFEENPVLSLELFAQVGATAASPIIDIGGGASRLVDNLLQRGFEDITVLDLSETALESAKARLGRNAGRVRWIVADVTTWQPLQTYGIWHDRAAFHFLTNEDDRAAYVARLRQALRIGGYAIISTFALDGPERCSGLQVTRYDPESLGRTLGREFEFVDSRQHIHATPWGAEQSFQCSVFRHCP